jgi:tyrosine-protein phosphatase SIW14
VIHAEDPADRRKESMMRPLSLTLATLAAVATACEAGPPPRPPPFAERIPVAGVANAARITPNLYRGAQPDKNGFASLKKMGIKTVISLRTWHHEAEAVKAAGMTPIEIPLQADPRGSKPPTPLQIAQFLKIVRDPSRQPVFFHCRYGEDRTGTMGAVYRMEIDGWNNADAYNEMKAFGFNSIWLDLRKFVTNYKPTHPVP